MPFDHDVLANVEATLDALSSPTPEQAYDALLQYDAPMVAAAAARRALATSGGGGSQTFAEVLTAGGDPEGNPVTGPLLIDGTSLPDAAIHPTEINLSAAGNVLLAEAQAGLTATPGHLGSIKMTDPSSPGETTWGYGRMSYILSSFDPPAGQAVFKIAHGSGAYTGDLILFGTMRVTASSAPVIAVHSAPADGELAAGECAMWFDQTNDSAKVMFKAKQADGAVKTGSVTLT